MVAMGMELDWIVVEVERRQRLHIRDSQTRADVLALVVTPAAARNLVPRAQGQLGQSFVGLSAQCDFTARFAHGGAWSGGRVWANRYVCSALSQSREPLLRYAKFRRRTTPEQVRRRGWNHQKIRTEITNSGCDLSCGEVLNLGIDE